MNGKGTFYYEQESVFLKYEGNFKDGKFQGQGTQIWRVGQWYEGDWENGKRHGFGTQFGSDGEILYKGQWLNDEHGD